MNFMSFCSRPASLAFALAAVGLIQPARADTIFDGQYTASGGNYVQARADWSSDLGPDYDMGHRLDSAGHIEAAGDGTGHTSRPVTSFDSDFTMDWQLNAKGGAAGNTFSGGQLRAPAAGSIENRIFNYHLYSELGDNDGGYGISTQTYLWQTHQLHLDHSYQPVYFAVRYNLNLATAIGAELRAEIQGPNSHGAYWGPSNYHNLHYGQLGAGTHNFAGMVTGMMNTYVGADYMYSYVGVSLSLLEWAGQPGSGRADLYMDLAYSSAPITEFPGSSPSVPEALPVLPVIAAALAGLVTLRRRCAT
jgi:hypothetical protein